MLCNANAIETFEILKITYIQAKNIFKRAKKV